MVKMKEQRAKMKEERFAVVAVSVVAVIQNYDNNVILNAVKNLVIREDSGRIQGGLSTFPSLLFALSKKKSPTG